MIEMLQGLTDWLIAIASILICLLLAVRFFLIQYGNKKRNWRKKF